MTKLNTTGDVKSLSPERSPMAMKDVKWLTHNCTVGFMVAGMWNNRYYASTSSIMTTTNRATAQDMMVSGDADGYLRLFRFVRRLLLEYGAKLIKRFH